MDRIAVLRAFVRLVELGSFSAVAQDQGVGQPTVSKWIAGLEEDLGVRLLDRTTRSMHPTEAGQAFYTKVSEALVRWDDALHEVTHFAHALRGRIRISAPVVFGELYVIDAVASFARLHPHVEIDLVLNDRYVRLVEEHYDLAVRVGVPLDSSLRAHKLGSTERVLVASPSYLEGRTPIHSPVDLEEHSCLIHSGIRTNAVWVFRQGVREERVRVRGALKANHSGALRRFALQGHGVALLASWLVRDAVERDDLRALLTTYALPEAPLYVLTPPGRRVSPSVRAFIDHLSELLTPLRKDPTVRTVGPSV